MNYCLTLLLCFSCLSGYAKPIDWFRNQDQKGHALMAQGKHRQAAQTFKNPHWRATAFYRAGHYAEAANLFAKHPNANNLYNLGNSFAYQQQFDKAIQAYESVLQQDPDHQDARFNLELVKKLKQQQKQQQQSENQPKENKKQAEKKSSENKQQQKQETPKQKDQPRQSPQLSRADQEKQKNNQQWLKRIQEEPQDLLKQKFLRDYIQRRKQGGFNDGSHGASP